MSEPKKVVAKECRFAVHIPTRSHDIPDYHLVKLNYHYDDGTTAPAVEYIKNFKRTFGVARKNTRTYEQKKEYEDRDNLIVTSCTQSDMAMRAMYALERRVGRPRMSLLTDSPYLYGADVSSTSIIKHGYQKRYPQANTPYTSAFFDIETDVVGFNGGKKTEEPIICSMTCGNVMELTVDKQFLGDEPDVEARYMAMMREYLGDVIDEHKLELKLRIVEGTVATIRESIMPLHTLMPDWVAVWSIGFDVPKMLDTLKAHNVDPNTIFCDPKLPPELRYTRFKKGSVKKVTASGAVKPRNPSEQWHSVLAPASFTWVDAMSAFRFIRMGAQEEQSYGLDAITSKYAGRGKLRIGKTENSEGLEWHEEMQKYFKIEYLCYAAFDTISMLLLEKKTKDLSSSLPVQCGITDFVNFNKQTKRFADDYHFFLQDRGKMVATVPPRPPDQKDGYVNEEDIADGFAEDDEEEDIRYDEYGEPITVRQEIMGLRGWIITLKPHMSVLGLDHIVAESPMLKTYVRFFSYDSDAVSAYPSATAAANVSMETCISEVIDIIGVPEEIFRSQNINLLQGHVNALEYGQVMHKLMPVQDSLALFADM